MPAVGAAEHEAALFEGVQGVTEAGVVDAQALAQGGPGERLLSLAEGGAHRLGEGRRWGAVAVDEEREGLSAAAGEAQQERIRGRCGTVLDGELQAPRRCGAPDNRRNRSRRAGRRSRAGSGRGCGRSAWPCGGPGREPGGGGG